MPFAVWLLTTDEINVSKWFSVKNAYDATLTCRCVTCVFLIGFKSSLIIQKEK